LQQDKGAAVLGTVHSFLERKFTRILQEPPSVRVATGVIVSATAVVVVGSGAVIRVLDHNEYPNIWVGMWWALQTVTTVGYGDVSPTNPSGRIIAAVVMLYGVAFVTIFVAAITSIFVARASEARGLAEHQAEQRIEARLDVIEDRLGRLEDLLRKITAA
jgi:hypothetical protein